MSREAYAQWLFLFHGDKNGMQLINIFVIIQFVTSLNLCYTRNHSTPDFAKYKSNMQNHSDIAFTGQDSIASLMQGIFFCAFTIAFPSLPILNTSLHMEAHNPQPMHFSLFIFTMSNFVSLTL